MRSTFRRIDDFAVRNQFLGTRRMYWMLGPPAYLLELVQLILQ
jgi:hypothetical protein